MNPILTQNLPSPPIMNYYCSSNRRRHHHHNRNAAIWANLYYHHPHLKKPTLPRLAFALTSTFFFIIIIIIIIIIATSITANNTNTEFLQSVEFPQFNPNQINGPLDCERLLIAIEYSSRLLSPLIHQLIY